MRDLGRRTSAATIGRDSTAAGSRGEGQFFDRLTSFQGRCYAQVVLMESPAEPAGELIASFANRSGTF